MSPTIRIDDEVYAELKAHAEPFIDTPNSVLRRLLRLDPASDDRVREADDTIPSRDGEVVALPVTARRRSPSRQTSTTTSPAKRARAAAGSLLPEEEYDLPLLEALYEAGGEVSSRDAIKAVGERLADQLTAVDRQELRTGVVRWANRVQFVRLRLIEQGLMARDTARGIWALSDAGRARVEEVRATHTAEG